MLELNVQVGNMWYVIFTQGLFVLFLIPVLSSFLPQDKVSEFAAMSPQQLLRETQRAAGDENLTNWHDTLITAGKELKQMSQVHIRRLTHSSGTYSSIVHQRGERSTPADGRT